MSIQNAHISIMHTEYTDSVLFFINFCGIYFIMNLNFCYLVYEKLTSSYPKIAA